MINVGKFTVLSDSVGHFNVQDCVRQRILSTFRDSRCSTGVITWPIQVEKRCADGLRQPQLPHPNPPPISGTHNTAPSIVTITPRLTRTDTGQKSSKTIGVATPTPANKLTLACYLASPKTHFGFASKTK